MGCKNRAHSISRPVVVKDVAIQGFVLLAWTGFSVCVSCFCCMWCFVSLFSTVSTSALNYLERLVSEMTSYVSSGTVAKPYTLTHSLFVCVLYPVRRVVVLTGCGMYTLCCAVQTCVTAASYRTWWCIPYNSWTSSATRFVRSLSRRSTSPRNWMSLWRATLSKGTSHFCVLQDLTCCWWVLLYDSDRHMNRCTLFPDPGQLL